MFRVAALLASLSISDAFTGAVTITAHAQDRSSQPGPKPDRPATPLSGSTFQSAETRALQDDESRNPGMLWVEQGAKLWSAPATVAPTSSTRPPGTSCASCHGDAAVSMKGVAARYPRVDADTVVNLEGRINQCRSLRQDSAPLAYESQELLSLTAFLAYQSRGMPRHTPTPDDSRLHERGRDLFFGRQGQLNLACNQCHNDLVGKKLRGDTISQAQTHGWPAYRLEWQTLGSLQRRLRACSLGVRAEVLDFGHPDYLALELYLAGRGDGLPMESPGVRR